MAYMLIHFDADYDEWKRAFDADPAGRAQVAKGYSISRGVDNPNDIFVRVEFASVEEAKSFRERSPELLRMDNGPELTANALRDWCRLGGSGASYIEPGSPWENPFVESFGGKVRDEVLAVEAFDSLLEAKTVIEDWRNTYNTRRPHSSLGWKTPAAYAAGWRT